MLESYVLTQRIVNYGYQQVRQEALEHFHQVAPSHILDLPPEAPPEVIDLTQTVVIDLTTDSDPKPPSDPTNLQAVQTSPPMSPIDYNVPSPAITPELIPDSPVATNSPQLDAGPPRCTLHRETQHQYISLYCDCPLYTCPYCLRVQPGHIVLDCPEYGDGLPAAWIDPIIEQAIQVHQQVVQQARPASR